MKTFIPAALLLSLLSVASAVPVVLMPDSTNNRVVAFSPVDGSVINNNVFSLQSGTPVSAIQVGNEVWFSEQVGDKISRWSWNGASLGSAGVGILDNVRGITLIDGVVYAANDGNTFGAADTLVRFDPSGTHLGNYSTAGLNTSPFYVYKHNGELLTTSAESNNDVHKFDLSGNSIGPFYNGANNFSEQIDRAADGSLLIAWFSSNKVAKHAPPRESNSAHLLPPEHGVFISSATGTSCGPAEPVRESTILPQQSPLWCTQAVGASFPWQICPEQTKCSPVTCPWETPSQPSR